MPIGSPLAARLIRWVFVAYFSCALLVGAAQLFSEYGRERQALQSEAIGAVQLVEPALSRALKSGDRAGAAEVARALIGNASIDGVEITAPGHRAVVAGRTPRIDSGTWSGALDTPFSGLYTRSYTLRDAAAPDSVNPLGSVTVHSEAATVLARLQATLYAVAVGALVKTLALWVVVYLAVKLLIATPLRRLADCAQRLNPDIVRPMPPASGERHDAPRADELHVLARAGVAMARALRHARRRVSLYQRDLGAMVEERTAQLRYQAERDPLTGLLNRRALQARVAGLPHPAGQRGGPQHALIYIDLDNFKAVNDTLGHQAGDALLERISQVLERATRPSDLVARLGGDEFAIVLKDCHLDDARQIADKIRNQVRDFAIDEHAERVRVGLSAGVVELEANGGDQQFTHALSAADTACYAAKAEGPNRVQVFGGNVAPLHRRYDDNWVTLLQRALKDDAFELSYTPLVAAHGGVFGMQIEAWLRSDDKLYAPGEFMPTAERHQLATRVDRWVAEHAIPLIAAQGGLLQRLAFFELVVSADSVAQPRNHGYLAELLDSHGIAGEQLCLSVADDIRTSHLPAFVAGIHRLRERGVRFAMHDFGQTHSPFARLPSLPVNMVQPAPEFVAAALAEPRAEEVLRSMLEFCHRMGMRVLVGPVDDQKGARRLTELGANYLFGPHIGESAALTEISVKRLTALGRRAGLVGNTSAR